MKKVIVNGLFLVTGAIITGIFSYKSHKVEIHNIIEKTIPKEDVRSNYIRKEKYEELKDNIENKENSLVQQSTTYKKYNDSLKKELDYLKLKCAKVSKITYPSAKFEADKMLFELEKAYRQDRHIVLYLRLTNLDNDKNFYLNRHNTIIQTPDGLEYSIKKILKGGKSKYSIDYDYKHNEDVLYSIHFGNVSSQLEYEKITFKTISGTKTQIIQELNLTHN